MCIRDRVTINPDQQRQPITRGDVAHTLAQVLTSGHAIRETFVVVNGATPVDEAVASL